MVGWCWRFARSDFLCSIGLLVLGVVLGVILGVMLGGVLGVVLGVVLGSALQRSFHPLNPSLSQPATPVQAESPRNVPPHLGRAPFVHAPMNDCYKLLLLVCGLYLFLCVMSDNNASNITLDIGGKKVPLSKINRPHNVVVGLMRGAQHSHHNPQSPQSVSDAHDTELPEKDSAPTT